MTTRTVGKAELVGRTWRITAEPHVLLRLRRLFRGTDQKSETIEVADTLESSRDLAWVCERWPLEVTPRDHMEARAAKHQEAEDSIRLMMSAGYTPRAFKMAGEPRDYQRVAADMALTMRSLLIADDLGLGKSLSAICAITDPSARPALVVTMTHLPRQWEAEIAKWAPGLRVHRIRDGELYDIAEKASRKRGKRAPDSSRRQHLFDFNTGPSLPDVIVTSYSKLVKWGPVLREIVRSVTYDECQELRGHETDRYAAALSISERADLVIGLSATPFNNYGGELFNVIHALAPHRLGTWGEFAASWCDAGEDRKKARLKEPAAFGQWARENGLMLRRTRSDVGRELPPLTKIAHSIDVDQAPIAAIENRAIELAKIIVRHGVRGIEKMEASQELSWKLRMATGIGKAPHAADFVRLLVESGEKVLVAAWHREVHSIIEERLRDLGVVMYTGEESTAAKEAAKRAFVDGDARVMLISLRSGAGLDGLQRSCRTVVHAELDWSPAIHAQIDGRPHRDGQTDPVMAYYLTCDSGSDPIVSDVLGVKTMQIEPVLDPSAPAVVVKQLDPEHVTKLARAYLARAAPDLIDEAVHVATGGAS